MGGKLGKAHNSYVVSGGGPGGSRSSGAMEEYLEERRHSESDLNYSGGATGGFIYSLRCQSKRPSQQLHFI